MSVSVPIDLLIMQNTQAASELLNELAAPATIDPLFGAFPELAAITDEDLAWAKAEWDQRPEKQLCVIDGQTV